MGIIGHHFSIRFHPCWLLCNLKSPLLQYMIWASSGIVFQFDFTHAGYYVIRSHHYHHSSDSMAMMVMVTSDYIITSMGEIKLKNNV